MKLLFNILFLLGIGFGSISLIIADDSEGCEEYYEEECLESEDCIWSSDEEECINSENDDDDDYEFESSAEFEFEESDIYYGKIRLKITNTNINILKFDLEYLQAEAGYIVSLDDWWEYPFTTDAEGNFEWNLRSDGNGDELLPDELIPVSQFSLAQLFDASGNLIAAAVFDDDDEGCSDLPQNICEAIPLCNWNNIQGCEENEWDFDDDDGDGISDDDDDDDDNDGIPDDDDDDDDNDGIPDEADDNNGPWNVGEYFSEEMTSQYSAYMDQYNQTGQGFFNYITLNPTRELYSDIGDEIGVLDYGGQQNGGGCDEVFGDQLVGAGIWTGEPLTIFTFGHFTECASGGTQYPGFISGNNIVIRVYKPTTGMYIDYDVQLTWGNSQASFEVVINSVMGDVNGDGLLNVLDIVAMVDMVLGFNEINSLADINGDNLVNVLDVIEMVNLVLSVN